ncbi:MAG: Rieske 2Fe-2S domain-containing protein [Anaerolineales bacterium]|nr:Rieske 2Fe-2S domain-containing protein [Anaerolineales bacterium]
MSNRKFSRKDFLNIVWGAAGTLAAAELSFIGLRFLSPRATDGEFGGVFNLGPYDGFPPGSVTPVETGRFYLVRLEDGGFLAVYRRCTHLGCAVPFDPAVGQFICPCHGSEFTMEGDVLNAPAPRPLDLFQLSINEAGEIVVDTSISIERDQPSPEHIVSA